MKGVKPGTGVLLVPTGLTLGRARLVDRDLRDTMKTLVGELVGHLDVAVRADPPLLDLGLAKVGEVQCVELGDPGKRRELAVGLKAGCGHNTTDDVPMSTMHSTVTAPSQHRHSTVTAP